MLREETNKGELYSWIHCEAGAEGRATTSRVIKVEDLLRSCAEARGAGDLSPIHIGAPFDNYDEDARAFVFQLHLTPEGEPSSIEMSITTRNGDGSAKDPVTASVPWSTFLGDKEAPALPPKVRMPKDPATSAAYVEGYDGKHKKWFAYRVLRQDKGGKFASFKVDGGNKTIDEKRALQLIAKQGAQHPDGIPDGGASFPDGDVSAFHLLHDGKHPTGYRLTLTLSKANGEPHPPVVATAAWPTE